jgi:cyclohexyl-isocyanide hydratase
MTETLEIGILLFPAITQLDITGPFEIFARLPNARVHLLWKDVNPVVSDVGLIMTPTTAFADCPILDVLCVGGGPGQIPLMDDDEVLDFLRDKGSSARYVTSVCAGSLLLAAAGLLTGYRSACHWLSRDQLAHFGVIAVNERIVIDGNRISGGGVTAGIDFGFQVAAILCGEQKAKELQLWLEYDPKPPFPCGSEADPEIVAGVRAMAQSMLKTRLASTMRAAERLRQKTDTITPVRKSG